MRRNYSTFYYKRVVVCPSAQTWIAKKGILILQTNPKPKPQLFEELITHSQELHIGFFLLE